MAFTRLHRAAVYAVAALTLALSSGGAGDVEARACPAPKPTPRPTIVATPQPTPSPTAFPAPTAVGIPPIPSGHGVLLRKDFSDGSLSPLFKMTYPDDHIGQPGQEWTVYNRFANGQVTVHDGYADLRATKRADGLWDAVLVGTAQDGSGFEMGWGRVSFAARANVGRGTWQGTWLADTRWTSGTEYDWLEMLEGQQIVATAHGTVSGSRYMTPPADLATVWHVFTIDRQPTYVAFLLDGVEKFRVTGTMPSQPLSLMLDAKIGFPWAEGPDSTTPDPTWLQVAWVTVDP